MKQSTRAHRCNVADKRNGKEKQKQWRMRRGRRESYRLEDEKCSGRGESYGLSWVKLLNLSVGLNLVNLFSLRCNLNVKYPKSITISHLILGIPVLCQKTARYTVQLFYYPFSCTTASCCPGFGKLKIPSSYEKLRWKGALRDVLGRGRTRRAIKLASSVLPRKLPQPVITSILKLALGPLLFARKIVERRDGVGWKRRAIYSKALTWQIKCYRMMPLKSLSTAWGFIHNLYLPVFLRPIFLTWYVKAFRCDLSEAEVEDLKFYKNLGELFRRNLKHGIRPIHKLSQLVSPVDGTILHFGKVDGGMIEQVKGITYSIAQFLGPLSWEHNNYSDDSVPDCDAYSKLIKYSKTGTSLFHCVIYLAPGDYHKFHSPTDWVSKFRRHFAGELLSVNPTVARIISGLFSLNERAVYVGSWVHGFFSFTAVGATNVGSIRVYNDSDLETNTRKHCKGKQVDKDFFKEPLHFYKGEKIGEFNLGSTIVLIFEAPNDFSLNVTQGQHVKVGEPLVLPKLTLTH